MGYTNSDVTRRLVIMTLTFRAWSVELPSFLHLKNFSYAMVRFNGKAQGLVKSFSKDTDSLPGGKSPVRHKIDHISQKTNIATPLVFLKV